MHASAPLPEDATVRHVIDANQSRFAVQVTATGLLSAFGHNPKIAIRDFDGNVEFMNGSSPLAGARMTLRIRANSLEAIEGVSDKDRDEINRRMRQEVLETDDYPEIVYECAGVTASGTGDRYWVALKGELTLHGTTKSMPVSARVTINGDSLRASGDFPLRQSDFGIAPVSAAAGTIRVKDEIHCTFDILARRQE
jgi:polyisoprenoid-binding protein YceI